MKGCLDDVCNSQRVAVLCLYMATIHVADFRLRKKDQYSIARGSFSEGGGVAPLFILQRHKKSDFHDRHVKNGHRMALI